MTCFFYHGPSDDEVAAGVDMVLGLSVEVLLRDADLDPLLHDVIAELGQGDLKIKFKKYCFLRNFELPSRKLTLPNLLF